MELAISGDKGRLSCFLFMAASFASGMLTRVGAEEREEEAGEDVCVVEVGLPEGGRVSVDGVEYGERRVLRLGGLGAGARLVKLVADLPGGRREEREVLIHRGWVVQVAPEEGDGGRRDLVLQTGPAMVGSCAAFSPSGQLVVAGSTDGSVTIWEAGTAKVLRRFQRGGQWDARPVVSVAFSGSGDYVLALSMWGSVAVWETSTGKLVREFWGVPGGLRSGGGPEGEDRWAEFNGLSAEWVAAVFVGMSKLFGSGPEEGIERARLAVLRMGKHIAVSRSDVVVSSPPWGETAVMWDLSTAQPLGVLRGHTGPIVTVGFSASGRWVLTGSTDGTAILWDAASQERLRTFAGISGLATFGPSDAFVVAESREGGAISWELATGVEVRRWKFDRPAASLTSLAVSPKGDAMLTLWGDTTAVLLDAVTGRRLGELDGHDGVLLHALFSPSGQHIMTVARAGAVLWDTATGEELRVLQSVPPLRFAVVSPWGDGALALIPLFGRTAFVWRPAARERLGSFEGHSEGLACVALSSSGSSVLTGSDGGTVILWDAASERCVQRFEGHGGGVDSVAFSPSGDEILTGSEDKTAILWDAATGRCVRRFEGHGGGVCSVAFSPSGDEILTGSEDKTAILWDAATGRCVRRFEGHGGGVCSVAFSPCGDELVTQDGDGVAVLWDAGTAKRLRAFGGFGAHRFGGVGVGFGRSGQEVIVGSGDGAVRVWDVATGREVAQLLVFSADDWLVVTPEGLFDGSEAGRKRVAYRWGEGLAVVPGEQFAGGLYRPGLLGRILRGERPLPGPVPAPKAGGRQRAGSR